MAFFVAGGMVELIWAPVGHNLSHNNLPTEKGPIYRDRGGSNLSGLRPLCISVPTPSLSPITNPTLAADSRNRFLISPRA